MKVVQTGWYLAFTKSNQENIAKHNLTKQGFHTYLPIFHEHKIQKNFYKKLHKPLFPRYIFIQLKQEEDWSKIRSTRGCISLICFSTFPAVVPDLLIEQIKNEEYLRLSENQTNIPNFKAGDKIKIVSGILSNYEGIVEKKNSKDRVLLLLTISENHTRHINLSVDQVKMLNE